MRWALLLLICVGCNSPAPTRLVVCDGNSLTYGGGTRSSYPRQLQTKLGRDWRVVNLGVDSQTTADMQADAALQVDALYQPGAVLVAWEITNDLYFGASADEACQRFADYCRVRKAIGWRVVALTVLPRQQPTLPADFESSRQAANNWLREHWQDFSDVLIDLDESPLTDPANRKWFADGVHLTPRGYGEVARHVALAL